MNNDIEHKSCNMLQSPIPLLAVGVHARISVRVFMLHALLQMKHCIYMLHVYAYRVYKLVQNLHNCV